jgi:hypothetical protein
MNEETFKNLGPLKPLVGIWEGATGGDTAPGKDRGAAKSAFREKMILETLNPVANHEQKLYGLRYSDQVFRLGETEPFHDEVGYWLWSPEERQVLKCISVPRGMVLMAGGTAEPDAKSFRLYAELGSPTFGICSNPFLDKEFQTVGFSLDMKFNEDGSFSYDQNTLIQIKGQPNRFEHRDKNTLRKVSRT